MRTQFSLLRVIPILFAKLPALIPGVSQSSDRKGGTAIQVLSQLQGDSHPVRDREGMSL